MRSAVTAAVWAGRSRMITSLLDHGAELNGGNQDVLLQVALEMGWYHVIRLLLRKGLYVAGATLTQAPVELQGLGDASGG
ncbi:hypothetical protein HDU93_004609, partial [Gonapodya sp. JEL0774]